MKLFAVIVLLTVPLVMATEAVDGGSVKASAKDEARALYDKIYGLYFSQMDIGQGHYADAIHVLFTQYGDTLLERWSELRNATIDEVTSKVERTVTDALNIGVDVRKNCYEDFQTIIDRKRNQSLITTLSDCINSAREGEFYSLAKIQNFGYLEIYSRIESTARHELAVCDGAANADPCYDNVIERLEMFKGRMINAENELRVMYATELAGHVDGCDSTFILGITEWKTETLKYFSTCTGYQIMNVVGQRNLGMNI